LTNNNAISKSSAENKFKLSGKTDFFFRSLSVKA